MTKRDTASLLIKLFGTYCLIKLIPYIVTIIGLFQMIGNPSTLFIQIFSVIIAIVFLGIWISFCIFVIHQSDSVAKRIFKEDSDISQLVSLSFEDAQVLGYNLIGLFLIVQTLPEILSLLSQLADLNSLESASYSDYNSYKYLRPKAISAIAQLIIGLVVFLRPKSLVNFWKSKQPRD